MPRALKLLLLALALAAPLRAPAQPAPQKPAAQPTPLDDQYVRGLRLYEQGDAAGAAPLLRDAAERRKKDADAWYFYGLALARLNNGKDARKAYEKSLKLRPNSADAHAGLAYSLILLGEGRNAERAARHAVALDRSHADAHYVLGLLFNNTERYAEAVVEAEEALRLKPDAPSTLALYADALLNTMTGPDAAQAPKHPPRETDRPETRKAARAPALERLQARAREVAARLDALAKARTDDPEVGRWREQAESLLLYARLGGENYGAPRQGETTKGAVITFKPEPSLTARTRSVRVTGRVRLRAVLGADGQVRRITVIKGLPYGLTEQCIAAAREIKFTPAVLDGRPVSQFVILEYNFKNF